MVLSTIRKDNYDVHSMHNEFRVIIDENTFRHGEALAQCVATLCKLILCTLPHRCSMMTTRPKKSRLLPIWLSFLSSVGGALQRPLFPSGLQCATVQSLK